MRPADRLPRRADGTAAIVSSYSAADAGAASARMGFAWAGFDVSVGVCARAIEAEWRELESRAVGLVFQSFDYVDVGAQNGGGSGGDPDDRDGTARRQVGLCAADGDRALSRRDRAVLVGARLRQLWNGAP
jgi:hypothetical protein